MVCPITEGDHKLEAKDVLSNIHCVQAAISVHCRHHVTPICDGMVPSAAG